MFKQSIEKVIVCAFVGILVLGFSSVFVFAHGGRTDDYGGHRDPQNASGLGPYHYHHEYGPHNHYDGYCPIDDCYYPIAPNDPDHPDYNAESLEVYSPADVGQDDSDATDYVISYDDDDIGDEKGEDGNGILIPGLFTGIAVIGGGAFINGRVQENKRRKKREEDRNKFIELLGGRSIREAAGVPANVYFYEGMPKDNNNKKYGSYTRYLSKSGNCYHEKQGCCSARYTAHAFNVAGWYKPCSKCCRSRVVIPEWYRNYEHLEKEADRLDISKDINVSEAPRRQQVVGELNVVKREPETQLVSHVKQEPQKPKTKPTPQARQEFKQPETKPAPQTQHMSKEPPTKPTVSAEQPEAKPRLRMVSFDINSNGRVEGKLNGKPVTFNSVWGQHTFTEEEIIRLLNDESITFQYTTKKGKTRTATGKLGYGTGKYANHFGFQPEDF